MVEEEEAPHPEEGEGGVLSESIVEEINQKCKDLSAQRKTRKQANEKKKLFFYSSSKNIFYA
jgi:hypothetical protein